MTLFSKYAGHSTQVNFFLLIRTSKPGVTSLALICTLENRLIQLLKAFGIIIG